jgi:hypothetical protein
MVSVAIIGLPQLSTAIYLTRFIHLATTLPLGVGIRQQGRGRLAHEQNGDAYDDGYTGGDDHNGSN